MVAGCEPGLAGGEHHNGQTLWWQSSNVLARLRPSTNVQLFPNPNRLAVSARARFQLLDWSK